MRILRPHLLSSVRFYSKKADKSVASSPAVTLPLNYVHGRRVDPKGKANFPLLSPATGQTLRSVSASNEDDVSEAVQVSRNALRVWSKIPGFERGQILKKAANIARERCEELASLEVLDTGKPIWEARCDIMACADTIEYYGGLAANINGEFMPLAGGSFAYTIREALGVVGGIGAWNYPFQMAAWKSSPALACGNSVVFKPSQFTPLTAVVLGEIYTQAGLPDGCFNVIQGEGPTGQFLSSHPGVDKVTFTGSVQTGSKIMEIAAKDVKHVTLELGGKSPLIIFEDADIDNAVKGAMLANFSNQGQVCSNGTRVFVEESILQDFVSRLIARVEKMVIGNPMNEDTTVGATIHEDQYNKVLKYIDIAKKEGAKIAYGGESVTPADPKLAKGFYLKPCILTNCKDEMTVVKEEVFGSIMSVLPFKTEDEVVRRANNSELGLAGGVFTKDLQRAHRVVANMETGSIYVNNYNVYPVGVPFGGFKKSGIGRENGADALNYYSQIKSVYFEGGDVDCPY